MRTTGFTTTPHVTPPSADASAQPAPAEADLDERRARTTLAIVLAMAMAPAIGLGIARFAYALVLPDMRADLGWSYAQAGWMNTTNAMGYLLGALLAARAVVTFGAARVTLGGAMACVASLALCAVLRDAASLNLARALAGVGGGLAFVAGGALAAGAAGRDPGGSSFLLALFYAGPGLGIALSGLIVPPALAWLGPGAWDVAWGLLAVASVPLLALLALGLRAGGVAAGPRGRAPAPLRRMGWLLAGYALFGAGYIAYMTFMIAWVREGGGGAVWQALFWVVLGGAAMASPWLWAGVLGRLAHGRAFALLCILTALGAALPLAAEGRPALLVSAALFGSVFFAVVASTTAFVRRNLPPGAWAAAIGGLTVAFGLGQMLGPVAMGAIGDRTGGLAGGLAVSSALLLLGAALGLVQRDL